MFQEEFRRFMIQLEVLKEKNVLLGNHHLVNKLAAMQEAANRVETQVSTIQVISCGMRLNDLNGSTTIAETDVGGSFKSDVDQKGKKILLSEIATNHPLTPVTLHHELLSTMSTK